MKVHIYAASAKTGVVKKSSATFDVNRRTADECAAAARARLEKAGAKIRSINHGPDGLIIYVDVK